MRPDSIFPELGRQPVKSNLAEVKILLPPDPVLDPFCYHIGSNVPILTALRRWKRRTSIYNCRLGYIISFRTLNLHKCRSALFAYDMDWYQFDLCGFFCPQNRFLCALNAPCFWLARSSPILIARLIARLNLCLTLPCM